MRAEAFHVGDQDRQDRLRVVHPNTTVLTRYRVDVIGSDAGDVVRSAGGWLFDRAMAGWDVNVLVPGDCDARPLQILGAATLRFDSVFASIGKGPWTQTLAVAVHAFTRDGCVRDLVVAALDRGAEVTLWGDAWPAELDHRVDDVQHRLTAAARTFKAHALAAAALAQHPVHPTERYRSRARWYSPGESDLVPLGAE
ncbi:hypothetical protein [Mycobacterium sp.]|uniref:hypothetical protein n=1 Tax=Mycobacterium sp. TaxID=1785 RepID=UPI002B5EDDA9|nr:hypothetical protein [Mycobacterium sp.]HME49510.1 hypothetical protein [Mycobacterium sp.]